MPPRVEYGAVTEPWWSDKPLAIVGTGPSLKGFDFAALNDPRWRVLAVKQAVWDLPFADACFGLDIPWMRRERERLIELAARIPLYLAVPDEEPGKYDPIPHAINLIRTRVCDVMSEKPTHIESGGNSGFGAVNLALLKRARRVVLFGYDYYAGHYCEDRYAHNAPGHNARYWPRWGENFIRCADQLKGCGMTVINASPRSTVDAFPKVTIAEGMRLLAEGV